MTKRVFFIVVLLFSCGVLSARSWDDISKSGKLFVLTNDAYRGSAGLHRIVMPIDREQVMLRRFAAENNLKIEYVHTSSFFMLFSMLDSGKGDLISANLSATADRKKKYLLSEPFDYTNETVFTATGSGIKGKEPKCLSGKTGWILPDTSYVESFRAFTAKTANITMLNLPMTITHEDLIKNVASGQIEYSVLDECDLDVWLSYHTGIRKLFPVRSKVPLVFAARKDSVELMTRLNRFISGVRQGTAPAPKAPTAEKKPQPSGLTGDLPQIRKRGFIRVLTTNSAFCCFLHKGQTCGFEYELAKRFGDSLNVSVVTVIPLDFKDLLRYLAEGKGDLIAANFTMTQKRVKDNPNATFCAPYCGVKQVLTGRPKEKLTKLEELAGRTIHVRKGNSYYDTVCFLMKKGYRFKIKLIPEGEGPLQTLKKVASGEYDLTVVDNTYLQYAIDGGCKVRGLLDLTAEQPFAWIVRKNNPQLAAAVNAFFKKENKGVFFNLCRKRYYNRERAKTITPYVFKDKKLTISPFDSLFRKYGAMYDFKWYFLAAQSYQESRFKPGLVNEIGAAGLMQVMPETAKELGITGLTNPENGINAGVKYMAKLRSRFDGRMTENDKLCFTLAAYNAGYGHVLDARALAVQKGLNPNVWFGNTEYALSLLEDPRYYNRAKYGYCRASETTEYVSNIMLQAYHYQMLLNSAEQKRKIGGDEKQRNRQKK